MSEWTLIISRKEEKRVRKIMNAIDAANNIIDDASITYTAPNNNLKLVWPTIVHKTSPLLSEAIGSTNSKDLLKYTALGKYKNVAELFNNYPIPIYHFDYDINKDIGHNKKGRRAPYIESYIFRIWTYAAEKIPIIHEYELLVDGYTNTSAPCYYKYCYSPIKTIQSCKSDDGTSYNISEDYIDCTLRLIELSA
jgi:hypothetical protein